MMKWNMKRNLFGITVLSVLVVTLHAQNRQECKRLYKNKEYEKAKACFKADTSEYGDARMQFFWAKTEEVLGNEDQAISAYERVVELDPKNYEATLKLVRYYTKNGRVEEAKEIVNGFDDRGLTPSQRTALAQLLTPKGKRLERFSAKVYSKMGYDSNIALLGSGHNLDLYAQLLGLTPEQREKLGKIESSVFSRSGVLLSYTNDLQEKGGWFVKVGINGLIQFNEVSLYNLKYASVEAALGYKFSKATLTLPLSYAYTYYLEKDLLSSYRFKPVLTFLLASNYIFTIDALAEKKAYFSEKLSYYDSETLGSSASLYYIRSGNYLNLRFGYKNVSTVHDQIEPIPPRYIDGDIYYTSFKVFYRPKPLWSFGATYLFNYLKYDDRLYAKEGSDYVLLPKRRTDKYHNILLNAGYDLTKRLKLTGEFSYVKNGTDYYIYDYDKNIINIGIEYNY